MNILAPAHSTTRIEIVYDLVCPWCFLGTSRLQQVLRQRDDLPVELIWRPFLLNPDMPRAGMRRSDYIIRKFGSEERAERLYASITEAGQQEGIPFRFDRIRHMPSSLDAHRLVQFAARFDLATDVTARIFSAYFTDGRNIGDLNILADIAGECGLDVATTLALLQSDEGEHAVLSANLGAYRRGITGVPCFIINGQHAIAGAQDQIVINRVLDIVIAEANERG